MKASDLVAIPDASQRLIQAHKFLMSIKEAEGVAALVRDHALLELRKEMSQPDIGNLLGLSQQRISQMEKRATTRFTDED